MLAIDDDTLYKYQWEYKLKQMRSADINAGLSYNLSCAKGRKPQKGHNRL
jgi:hypothetical protein